MRAVPRTAPTMIPIIFPEELSSGDGDADGDEDVARGRLGGDAEVILNEELVMLEDFVAEDAVAVPVAVDGLADTMSPFSKNTPFL